MARNPELRKQEDAKWRNANRERIRKLGRIYYQKHREEICERQRNRARSQPPKKCRKTSIKTGKPYVRNKDKIREYRRRRRLDPAFIVYARMRNRLNAVLKIEKAIKHASSVALVGCGPIELKRHIESQFKEGMTWENRRLWHIDHVKPCASFDLTNPNQQRACFHFSNLQPLWAPENRAKSATYNGVNFRRPSLTAHCCHGKDQGQVKR